MTPTYSWLRTCGRTADARRCSSIEPRPKTPYNVQIGDPDDLWVLAAAVDGGAEILVTGDKELRAVDSGVPELQILLPREFIDMFGGKAHNRPA